MRRLLVVTLALGLAACASAPKKPAPAAGIEVSKSTVVGQPTAGKKVSPYAPAQENPGTRGDYVAGGLYKPGVADSTPDHVPDVDLIPEPEVVAEPRSKAGNRSRYTVLGKQYRVLDSAEGYVEEGTASYYGQKFHGRRTSNLEVYDMYAFTAAHKSLPLPSFVRVTNLDNGQSVVVRVNDRGPFHAGRIIDLSYAAAVKLGITRRGTGRVEVRALTPEGTELARAPVAPATPARTAEALAVATPMVGPVVLQVASYTARGNAERALAQLRDAGIDGARLHDADANGQKVWRLRVGPLAATVASDITARIVGLGFGSPQLVQE